MKINGFIFLLVLSILIISCDAKLPVITSINPKIGRMGEVITLTGSNFGEERSDSYITIAGIAPTSSSYFIWQDDTIMVKVPELGESGLVFVFVKGKKSNGVLFSNIASVPRQIDGDGLGTEPNIISVTPQTGAPGTRIIISGINFGTRDNYNAGTKSGVFFSWDYTQSAYNPFAVLEQEFIEVSDNELGYESWTTREIIVRVPDGAVSGNLEVRTTSGKSRPIFFDVSGRPGSKKYSDKRSYTVTYSVDIKVLEATLPNNLNLWVPSPAVTSSQRNIRLISDNTDTVVERERGFNIYRLNNLVSEANHSINVSYQVDVYTVETEIMPVSVTRVNSPLSAEYTKSTTLIPSDNSAIATTAASIIGREQNPYIKAKLIYDWMLNNIRITNFINGSNASAAINQKRADSYSAALLYSALLRAANIPCVPVAGVLIDQNGQTVRHYWTEFWIDSFGWLPADPALGAGTIPSSFAAKENYADFYFGNIDNQRIALSWDQPVHSRLNRGSRTVSRPQSYSLQNIWEESAGGLESYTSLWGEITITGIYTH